MALLHAEPLPQLMMHVFETQPPVQTDGHEPLSTGSAGHRFPASDPPSGVPPEQCAALQVAPPVQANVEPQPPQLLLSFAKSTQAPLHRVYPLSHAKVQAPLAHCAVALAMLVEHGFPHLPQSLTLLVVSTHVLLQSVGVEDAQAEAHTEALHTGVSPLHACALPQPPQLLLSLVKSTQAPSQAV